ncbi:GNAT family N-acetyltransferase [Candidatus Nomurabacteria bacterium]|nr:GNAT family N-acetyltransferase [Candidatus Nomurabacteria bacterium]
MYRWDDLANNLNSESDLLGGRLSADLLERKFLEGQAVLVSEGLVIVAFAALWETPDDRWFELGSVWVHPRARGRGLASEIFGKLLVLANDISAFLLTHNDKVSHLAQKAGWRESSVDTWDIVPWSASCGVCDRLATHQQRLHCPLRAVPEQCRLFSVNPPK